MLAINNLTKKFDNNIAIQIDNLHIHNKEIVGLVGNNGAGKTTLFRLILDLYETDNGFVESKGRNVAKYEDWKNYTGAFIDEGFLIEFLTPEEYFYFIGKCNNLSKIEIDERLQEFEKFMSGEILEKKKYIYAFSMGNKQKIGIIGAMLKHPEILILDEPFNYLDPSSQIEMKRLLVDFNLKYGTTMILSSHNIEHITDVSTRILLLEKGKLVSDIKNFDNSTILELKNYFE